MKRQISFIQAVLACSLAVSCSRLLTASGGVKMRSVLPSYVRHSTTSLVDPSKFKSIKCRIFVTVLCIDESSVALVCLVASVISPVSVLTYRPPANLRTGTPGVRLPAGNIYTSYWVPRLITRSWRCSLSSKS